MVTSVPPRHRRNRCAFRSPRAGLGSRSPSHSSCRSSSRSSEGRRTPPPRVPDPGAAWARSSGSTWPGGRPRPHPAPLRRSRPSPRLADRPHRRHRRPAVLPTHRIRRVADRAHDAGPRRRAREHRLDHRGEAAPAMRDRDRDVRHEADLDAFSTLSQNRAPSVCSAHSPNTAGPPGSVKASAPRTALVFVTPPRRSYPGWRPETPRDRPAPAGGSATPAHPAARHFMHLPKRSPPVAHRQPTCGQAGDPQAASPRRHDRGLERPVTASGPEPSSVGPVFAVCRLR